MIAAEAGRRRGSVPPLEEESVFTRRFASGTKLTDAVYDEIRDAIVTLRLRPGTMLRESALAEQLGISKTPVREALLQLTGDGLVEHVPYRGATVTGYEVEDVVELFELRAMVQAECVRLAVRDDGGAVAVALGENISAARAADGRGDREEVLRLLDEFDETLLSRLRNRRILSLMDNLQAHMQRIGKLMAALPGRVAQSLDQHDLIVQAMRDGDAEGAAAAMRAHIDSVLQDEIDYLEANQMLGEGRPDDD